MLVQHRELKRIVEEILVVLDIQILVINFVGGDSTQLVKDVPFGTGHVEITADRFPSANLAGIDIKFGTAKEQHQKTGFCIAAF